MNITQILPFIPLLIGVIVFCGFLGRYANNQNQPHKDREDLDVDRLFKILDSLVNQIDSRYEGPPIQIILGSYEYDLICGYWEELGLNPETGITYKGYKVREMLNYEQEEYTQEV